MESYRYKTAFIQENHASSYRETGIYDCIIMMSL